MGMPDKWIRGYRPDPAVLKVVEDLRAAVESGQIRAIAVVIINPMLDVECRCAGDSDKVRKRLLHSGLLELSQKVLSDK